MSIALQILGGIWAAIGIILVLGSFFGGWGLQVLAVGVGLGLFPGFVLIGLGRISEQIGFLVKRLAPEEKVQQTHRASGPDPAPTPTTSVQVRPPWEKDPNG